MPSSAEHKRLSLATLLAPITESTMLYEGEELHIRWRLAKLTPEFQARAMRDAGSPELDAANLSELLVSWDLMGDDGEPYPTTKDALVALPVVFLGAVSNFLVTAVVPKAQSERSSAASSDLAES